VKISTPSELTEERLVEAIKLIAGGNYPSWILISSTKHISRLKSGKIPTFSVLTHAS
jgi:hypothetical protein